MGTKPSSDSFPQMSPKSAKRTPFRDRQSRRGTDLKYTRGRRLPCSVEAAKNGLSYLPSILVRNRREPREEPIESL